MKIFLNILLIGLISAQEIRWDWSRIDTNDVKFPKDFMWGVATAAYHIEGNLFNNNWYEWEQKKVHNGKPTIKNNDECGLACDHWQRWEEDFKLLKKLGVNSYRLSVEWSRIEPEAGKIDNEALEQYKKMCKWLVDNSIKPMVTIHHFSNPVWFEKLGAFENQENIKYLVSFAEIVYDSLHEYVEYWCTLNEPDVYAAQGYFLGEFPPGKKDVKTALKVLENLLSAHTEIYHIFKNKPDGANKQVGIVKQMFQFDPYNRFNPLDIILCKILDGLFNQTVIEYLKTGKFKFRIPFFHAYESYNPKAKMSSDFFGLNYYSHAMLKFKPNKDEFFRIMYRDGDIVTDIPHSIYAEGIYRAIKEVSDIGLPIIITENGIADAQDLNRLDFLKKYLYAVSKAIDEGADIKGYFYFSLLDNFEWAEGYYPRFGLYSVDYKTQKRKLRSSAKYFKNIIKCLKNKKN